MSEHKLFVKPVSPSALIEGFILVANDVIPNGTISNLNVETSIGNLVLIKEAQRLAQLANQESIAEKSKFYKDRDFLEVTSASFHTSDGWNLTFADYPNTNDAPCFTLRVDQPNPEKAAQIADALSKRFSLIRRSEFGALKLPKDQLEGLKFAERTIGSFATEAAKLSQTAVKNFEDFTRLVTEKSVELEARFDTKGQELEAKYEAKVKDLDEREKRHTEEVKQFELRNNTVVRRDLLKEIRKIIGDQKSMEVSKSTKDKRTLIHVLCGVTLTLAAALAITFVFKIASVPQLDWHYLIPISTGTVIFVSTGIFYLKWNDQWFRDHARVEFENRKFSADVLRASWIAELFFEWENKKETNMPPELIASFTRNLFENQAGDSRLHPYDQFSDILKHVSSLKVSKGALEITKADVKP